MTIDRNGTSAKYSFNRSSAKWLYGSQRLLGVDHPSALGKIVTITIFKNVLATQKREISISLSDFAELIDTTEANKKADLPLFKAAAFGNNRTSKGSYRHDDNLMKVFAIEVEYDGEKISPRDAVRLCNKVGIAVLCYTTPSHSADRPRWRMVFICMNSIDPSLRASLVDRINGILGGILSRESWTLSQAFFYGSLKNNTDFEIILSDGDFIDMRTDLDAVAIGRGESGTITAEKHDRSKIAWGLAMDVRCNEGTFADFRSGVLEDPMLEAWVREKGVRQLQRAWDRTATEFQKQSDAILSKFDSLPNVETPVDALNKRHAVVRIEGRTLIATFAQNGEVSFGTEHDLRVFYANNRVPNSLGRMQPISDVWIQSKNRKTYPNGVKFDPSGKIHKGKLNLWSGWAVDPNPNASCDRFLEHLRLVIANGNQKQFKYLIGWLADIVQNPGRKPGVALVLKGGKGAGKDTVAEYVTCMIGQRYCPTIAQPENLTGRFNADMATALLLHVQEGYWAGDRKAESVLKYLVTSPTVAIERKGIDRINLDSYMRISITSNSEWIVPASADERRYAVFNVSDEKIGDRSYFKALRAEMEGEGPSALLAYLFEYDLTDFNVHQPPLTVGLRDQKLASLRNFEKWWFDVLDRGHLPDVVNWHLNRVSINSSTLAEHYNQFAKNDRHTSQLNERAIGVSLAKVCPDRTRKMRKRPMRVRYYELPTLSECRQAFEKWAKSSIDWDETDNV